MKSLLTTIFCSLLATLPVTAQETSVTEAPPAEAEYMDRKIAVTMHFAGAPWLTRESRQREEDCDKMLAELGLKSGMTVVDMGCGNGFYTLQLADRVEPDGRVIAVEIQQEMLRLLEERADDAQLENIDLVLGTPTDPRLPPGTVDLILCVDVYHEFTHPAEMLAAMRTALKPTGSIVLVEFRAEDPDVPIKPLHKMSKRQILKELKANGFKFNSEFDGLPWQHMMFFGPSIHTQVRPEPDSNPALGEQQIQMYPLSRPRSGIAGERAG